MVKAKIPPSPSNRAGGQSPTATRKKRSRELSHPKRELKARAASPLRDARSPSRDSQKNLKIYCIFCKRKTKTNGMVLKTSSNNRTYYSGECDICHKRKCQFV